MTTSLKDFDFLYEYTEEEKIIRRKAVLKFMDENNLFGAYYEALYNQAMPIELNPERQEAIDRINSLRQMRDQINKSIDFFKSKLAIKKQ